MPDLKTDLETLIAGMRPVLAVQGKAIHLISAEDKKIRFGLQGFCGGCGCSQEYVDGLRELVSERYPDAELQFENV